MKVLGRAGALKDLDVATKAYEASDLCKLNYGRRADETFTFGDLIQTIHENGIDVVIIDGKCVDGNYINGNCIDGN